MQPAVFFEEKGPDIIVHPATPEFYDRICGVLKGGKLTETLEEFRREENKHEERKFGKN